MYDDFAFLRLIAETPQDDAPRLIYADYLEESGQDDRVARAEFIRLQIRAAQLTNEEDVEFAKNSERQRKLLETWHTKWLRPLASIPHCGLGNYSRGFLEGITITPTNFYVHSHHLIPQLPLQKLNLISWGREYELQNACSTPEILTLREIAVESYYDEALEQLKAFLDLPKFSRLQRLTLLGDMDVYRSSGSYEQVFVEWQQRLQAHFGPTFVVDFSKLDPVANFSRPESVDDAPRV